MATSFTPGDRLVFSCTAVSPGRTVPLTIFAVSTSGVKTPCCEFFATPQPTRHCARLIAAAGLQKVVIEPQIPGLTDIKLENYGPDVPLHTLPSGSFLLADQDELALDHAATKIGTDNCIDVCTDGDYLYAIGDGRLSIYSLAEPTRPALVGQLAGLGSVRQIALAPNRDAVLITARQDGLYIVDIRDRSAPGLIYAYDTIEFATGLAVAGDYAFVTCRIFGIEIIDISSYAAPRHVGIAYAGEAQSCVVADGYLYAGCWGECRVEVFDVRDPAHPRPVTHIPLHGKGDGLAVREGVLYAATGHHPRGVRESDTAAPGWGLGNGMDIYDVRDIADPKYLSTVKTEGNFFKLGEDYWTVRLSGRYAYLVNTYTGVTVVDISDPAAPVKRAHISVRIPNTSADYARIKPLHGENGPKYHFPYDTDAYLQTPVGNVAAVGDCLYIAGNMTGLHVATGRDYIAATEAHANAVPLRAVGEFYAFPPMEGVRHARVGGQVYSAVEQEGLLWLACGNGGIKICDTDLNVLSHIPTQATCFDVALFGDRLYAAEGMAGLCVYEISGLSLKKLGQYVSLHPVTGEALPVRQIALGPGANFALISVSGHLYEAVDLRDPTRIRRHVMEPAPLFPGALTENVRDQAPDGQSGLRAAVTGLTYYRNFTPALVAGRYCGVYWHMGYSEWVDMGDGAPRIFRNDLMVRPGMPNGHTALGDKALMVQEDGLAIYDPLAKDAPMQRIPAAISGKPVIKGGLMVTTHRYGRRVCLTDISDPANPIPLRTIDLPGNPGNAFIAENCVYIPYGNAGVLKIDL